MVFASMAYRVILRICSSEKGLLLSLLNASITLSKLMPLSAVIPLVLPSSEAVEALSGSAMLILPAFMASAMDSSLV